MNKLYVKDVHTQKAELYNICVFLSYKLGFEPVFLKSESK